jgi:hypothetical protein
VVKLQRAFRAYKLREKLRKEEIKKHYADLRASQSFVLHKISLIQRNWRLLKYPGDFPRHVKMIVLRLVRQRRAVFYNAAVKIQRQAKWFVSLILEERATAKEQAVRSIWRLAKAYLLRLKLWDRVQATRERRRIAANKIKRFPRPFFWRRNMLIRLAIRRAKRQYQAYINSAATVLQRFVRRKHAEYYGAVRVASRY